MSQPLLPKTAFNAVNQKFWEETSGSESDSGDAEDIVPDEAVMRQWWSSPTL